MVGPRIFSTGVITKIPHYWDILEYLRQTKMLNIWSGLLLVTVLWVLALKKSWIVRGQLSFLLKKPWFTKTPIPKSCFNSFDLADFLFLFVLKVPRYQGECCWRGDSLYDPLGSATYRFWHPVTPQECALGHRVQRFAECQHHSEDIVQTQARQASQHLHNSRRGLWRQSPPIYHKWGKSEGPSN